MPSDAEALLWISISELAKRAGIAQPGMSKRINRLVSKGLLEIRLGPQGAKLINIVAYDRLRARTADGIRSLAIASTRNSAPPAIPRSENLDPDDSQLGDPSLAKEQARRVGYQAELAKLDLQERLKELLPAEEVQKAFEVFGEKSIRALERFLSYSDEIATAVGKDGSQGARTVLKKAVHEVRKALAADIQAIMADAATGNIESYSAAN